MEYNVIGVYHNIKDQNGRILNDSLICLGSVVEVAKFLGCSIQRVYNMLYDQPEGLEVVRLFVEVR